MDLIFSGKIEKGKIILEDSAGFKKYVQSFEGKKIQLSICKYKTKRSLKQNAYYFGVIIPIIADWVGEDDKEAIHEALKNKFLEVRDNKGLKIVQSTAKLNTTQFEIYLERIRKWASIECGLVIPDPKSIK